MKRCSAARCAHVQRLAPQVRGQKVRPICRAATSGFVSPELLGAAGHALRSNPHACVLALDVGSSSAKAAVVSSTGAVVAFGEAPYRRGTRTGPGGCVEQYPEDWVVASRAACEQCVAALGSAQLVALTITGAMQNAVLLASDDGRLARGTCLMYSDARACEEAAQVAARTHALADTVPAQLLPSNAGGASSVLAKWLWLTRHEPDVVASSARLLLGSGSYVIAVLTAGAAVCDVTTASTTGLLAFTGADWCHAAVMTSLGLDAHLLPALCAVHAPVGVVSSGAASAHGFPAQLHDLPLFHAPGDLACTAVGAAASDCGQAHVYMGTSGWVAVTAVHASAADAARAAVAIQHGGDGHAMRIAFAPLQHASLEVAATLNAGACAEWAAHALFGDNGTVDDVMTAAAEAPPGSGGVMFVPYLRGERSPVSDNNARGSFVGVGHDTTRHHLARAVLEGVAFNYRACMDALAATRSQCTPPPMPLLGGGARSPVWCSIMADVLNTPLRPVSEAALATARGAAAVAMQGLLGTDELQSTFFQGGHVVKPDAGRAALYDSMYGRWGRVYGALKAAGVQSGGAE